MISESSSSESGPQDQPRGEVAGVRRAPVGAPFRGVLPYGLADREIFFGRDEAIRRAVEQIRSRRRGDERKGQFLLILGDSGVGKTSFVMAGLLPALISLGEGAPKRRYAIMTASGQDSFLGMARALSSEHALPGLLIEGDDCQALSERLRNDTVASMAEIYVVLNELRKEEGLHEFDADEPGLVVVVDQFERLFGRGDESGECRALCEFLGALAESGNALVLAVLRSDFRKVLGFEPVLERICGDGGIFTLGSPTPEELGRIIREPARLAGMRFECDASGLALDERIRDEASSGTRTLAFVQLLLQRLYALRTNDLLTWSAYDRLGGLSGVIRSRAEKTLAALPASVREACFTPIFGKLVRASSDGQDRIESRKATVDELVSPDFPDGSAERPGAREFLEAFVQNRILTVEGSAKRDRIEFEICHPSLLQTWEPLRILCENHRDDLEVRERVEALRDSWVDSGCQPRYPKAAILDGELIRRLRGDASSLIGPNLQAFLSRIEEGRRRRTVRRAIFAAALLCTTSVLLFLAWNFAESGHRGGSPVANREGYLLEQLAREADGDSGQNLSLLAQALAAVAPSERLERFLGAELYSPLPRRQIGPPLACRDAVLCLDVSSDGKMTAAANSRGEVGIWDAESGKRLREIAAHGGPIQVVRFTSDGTLVTGGSEGSVRFWSSVSGEPNGATIDHTSPITDIAIDPDGKLIAIASEDGLVRFWDISSRTPTGLAIEHPSAVRDVQFLSLGSVLATSCSDGGLRFWDLPAGTPRGDAVTFGEGIRAIAASPSGERVAIALNSGLVEFVDSESAKKDTRRLELDHPVTRVQFSPDGKWLATAGIDRAVRLWDAETLEECGHPFLHGDAVIALDFDPDGSELVCLAADSAITRWRTARLQALELIFRHPEAIRARFDARGGRIATAGADGSARIWDAANGVLQGNPLKHGEALTDVAFSPSGEMVATAGVDGAVRLWDSATGNPINRTIRMATPIKHLLLTPDGKQLITVGEGGDVKGWDVQSGEATQVAFQGRRPLQQVSLCPAGKRLLAVDDQGSVQIWDLASSSPMAALRAIHGGVVSAVFSPNGSEIMTVGADGRVLLWDDDFGAKPTQLFSHHKPGFRDARYSWDGRWVLTIDIDDQVAIWEASTGQLASAFEEKGVKSAVFGGQPEVVLTQNEDSTTRIRWIGALANESDHSVALLEDLANAGGSGKTKQGPGRKDDAVAATTASWLQAESQTRSIWPGASVTVEMWADREIDWAVAQMIRRRSENEVSYAARLAGVLATLEKVHSVAPQHPLIHLVLAGVEGSPSRAEALRRYGLSRLPANPAILGRAARIAALTEAPATDRLVIADLMLKVDANHLEALRLRAIAVDELGETQKLLPAWSAVLAHPDVTPELAGEAIYSIARHGTPSDFASALEAANVRFPKSANLQRIAGWSFLLLNNGQDALSAFESALELEGDATSPTVDLLLGKACAYWLAGQTDQAVEVYQQVIQQSAEWADRDHVANLHWPDAEVALIASVQNAALGEAPGQEAAE